MSGKLTRADYPNNWRALRAAILARAAHCCECTGECGSNHQYSYARRTCGIPNHATIARDPAEPWRWWLEEEAPRFQLGTSYKLVKCILTIAHLCQDSTCDELEHLRAMCQRCHLVFDRGQHTANARQTRVAMAQDPRQLFLPGGSA